MQEGKNLQNLIIVLHLYSILQSTITYTYIQIFIYFPGCWLSRGIDRLRSNIKMILPYPPVLILSIKDVFFHSFCSFLTMRQHMLSPQKVLVFLEYFFDKLLADRLFKDSNRLNTAFSAKDQLHEKSIWVNHVGKDLEKFNGFGN